MVTSWRRDGRSFRLRARRLLHLRTPERGAKGKCREGCSANADNPAKLPHSEFDDGVEPSRGDPASNKEKYHGQGGCDKQLSRNDQNRRSPEAERRDIRNEHG